MPKPEQALWKWLADRMGGAWSAQRIESTTTAPGIPDVYFSCAQPDLRGWIELKSYKGWGVESTVFDLPTWGADQRNWMRRHRAAGGRTWLFVEIRDCNEVLILPDAFALDGFGQLRTAVMRKTLYVHERRALDAKGILDALLQE